MVSEERKLYTDEYGRKKHGPGRENDFKRQKMDFMSCAEVDRDSGWNRIGLKHGGYISDQGLGSVSLLKHNESLFTLSVKGRSFQFYPQRANRASGF